MESIETGHAERDHARQHVRKARDLLVGGDRGRAAIGPRRFRADVDDVGALRDHVARMRDRRLGVEKLAAVGKGIRRDIEDAHDERALAGQKLAQERRAGRRKSGRGQGTGFACDPAVRGCKAACMAVAVRTLR